LKPQCTGFTAGDVRVVETSVYWLYCRRCAGGWDLSVRTKLHKNVIQDFNQKRLWRHAVKCIRILSLKLKNARLKLP